MKKIVLLVLVCLSFNVIADELIFTSDDSECDVIIATLWSECKGAPTNEMEAVASVISWRYEHNYRGAKTYKEVCLKKKAFSAWNDGKIYVVMRNDEDIETYRRCMVIANTLVSGEFTRTIDASHFHSINVTPYWSKKLKFLRRIGDSLFYVEKRHS